jgi:large subunit ribosomal protein L20
MPRVKPGKTTRKWHKKILKLAKGGYGARSKRYATALTHVMRAGNFAWRDRRNKKRDMRRLWIERINAGAREHGLPYHVFIHGLKLAKIELDRKQISELAIHDPAAFAKLVELAKAYGAVATAGASADAKSPTPAA